MSYLKLFFWKYYFIHTVFYIRWHVLVDIIRFSNRKSQSQQKLAKRITHFTMQFRPKNLTYFTKFSSVEIASNMLLLRTFQTFPKTYFCLVPEKTFALHHLLTHKNCILEAIWMKMSVNLCITLHGNFWTKIWTK